jgi:hypothetical protein
MPLLKILTRTLRFQDYFVKHLILSDEFRITIGHVRVARVHHIFGPLFIQEVVFLMFSLRNYSISDRTMLGRSSDYLAVWILIGLLLADIILEFKVSLRRTEFFLLLNFDKFFLNRYLAFFDNTEMSFLVNQLNFPFKPFTKRLTFILILTFRRTSIYRLLIHFNLPSIL